MRGCPYDDFGSADPFPYTRPDGPHRPGPCGDRRPERLPWNSFRDPDFADGQRGKDRCRSPVMVFVGVGQREDVDPPDSLETQKWKNRAFSRVSAEGASPVDQHVPTPGKRNDLGRALSDVQRREGEIPLGKRGIRSVDPSEKERGGEDGRGPGPPPAPKEKDRSPHGRHHGKGRPRDARRGNGEAPRAGPRQPIQQQQGARQPVRDDTNHRGGRPANPSRPEDRPEQDVPQDRAGGNRLEKSGGYRQRPEERDGRGAY